MSTAHHGMTVANDATLEQMIRSATRRLVVVTPGMNERVARVLADKWRALGAAAVAITLDVDPEVCRLGFGEFASVKLLETTAILLQTRLHSHPGLRIAVVIADDETLIYAPTAQHVEASPVTSGSFEVKPNAIRIETVPAPVARDLGMYKSEPGAKIIGVHPVSHEHVKAAEAELKAAPPQAFDLSRLLRVFSARIQFVELRLSGCMLARRRIEIPSDLVGLVDDKTRKLLESNFRLFEESETGVWGDEVRALKDHIVKRFLVQLPTYGSVLRTTDKPKFAQAVHILCRMLNRARTRKLTTLQTVLDSRVKALEDALLPAVEAHPPERWRWLRRSWSLRELLHKELRTLTGSAESLLRDAEVQVRYKGVTYETLKDPKFIEAVQRRLPDLPCLCDERLAAPAVA